MVVVPGGYFWGMDVWRLVARGGHHILLFPSRSCGGIIGDSAARL